MTSCSSHFTPTGIVGFRAGHDGRTQLPVWLGLFAAALMSVSSASARADTFPIESDTYTKRKDASVNFGSAAEVRIQKWSDITGFAKFDLSGSTQGSFDIATLNIPAGDIGKSGIIEIYEVLGGWSELALTHDQRPSLATIPVATVFVTTAEEGLVVSVDITPLVNSWLANPGTNYGLALVPGDVNFWADSREVSAGMFVETRSLLPTPTPDNRFPQNGELNISSSPTLDLSCSSQNLAAAQFQISSQSNFASVIYDSGNQSTDICSHRASADLPALSDNFWRGRQRSLDGSWSDWSVPTSFSVADTNAVVANLFQDGQLGYSGTADADIRGSGMDPQVVIRNWNQGAQDVLRTGRRPPGSSTDEIYRTLLRFDVSSLSSSGPVINAWIELTGWRHDDASHNQNVAFSNSAYRVLKRWGEGTGIIDSPASGETSWLFTENPQLWTSPGAGAASDTAADADRSATPIITSRPRNLEGQKTVLSSRELLNLVRFWIDNPSDNNGLLLKADDESAGLVMNFASREHADVTFRPRLVIESTEAVSVPDNQAPSVSAGGDITASVNATVQLGGSVLDDGLPNPPGNLNVVWSVVNGPGAAIFTDATNPLSEVRFDVAGTYVLNLQADDGALQNSDQLIVTVVEGTTQHTFPVSADSYVNSSLSDTNFGASSLLRVQNYRNRTAFIEFSVGTGAPTTVTNASLSFRANKVKKGGTVSVHKVLGDWDELVLTDNNKPALGPVATSFTVSTTDTGRAMDIDITDLVNQLLADPANDFGIALVPDNVNLWIDSRENGSPMQIVAASMGSHPNTAPQVDAGVDQMVVLPGIVDLSGSVSDDGFPNPPAQTAVNWSVQSGPGQVIFSEPNNPNSTASFAVPGSYELRLAADDGELTSSDSIIVSVADAGANQVPSVSAGGDFTVGINVAAQLDGAVSDDGLPDPPGGLVAVWSVVDGPGTAIFTDPTNPLSEVRFDTAGTYILNLQADDGALQTSDDLMVTVVQGTTQRTFPASADSYVNSSQADTNFGGSTLVRVQSYQNRIAFMKFAGGTGAPATISNASLSFLANKVKKGGTVSVHKVLRDWNEFTLTDNNKPPLGSAAIIFTVSTTNTGQLMNVDITDLFNLLLADPANDFGIALVPDNVNLWIDSRESGSPMIIVGE